MILIAGRIVIWANYYQATSEAGKVGEVGRASAADRCRRYPVREENFSSVCCFLPFVPENRRIWIIDDQIEIEGNARFGHCADTPFAFPFTDTERPRPYALVCRLRFGGGNIIPSDQSHPPTMLVPERPHSRGKLTEGSGRAEV